MKYTTLMEHLYGYKGVSYDPYAFVELQTPLSASPYYAFLDEFLLGLKLESYYDHSTECIDAIVFTGDDVIYF